MVENIRVGAIVKGKFINHHYGNPYKCDIGNLGITHTSDTNVTIQTVGHAYRV